MKLNNWICALAVALIGALIVPAVPAFAQLGVGVGVGGQTKAGGGVSAAGTQVGTGVQTGANAGVKTRTEGQPEAGADVGSNARLATRIQSNPQLAARVQSMLPSGLSMSAASAGFKNEGQFISALHASQNLNIPFEQLKTRMTGSAAASLGSAIQASKPGISEKQASAEAKKAETQAKATATARASETVKANGR
jgi:hypothetical protein